MANLRASELDPEVLESVRAATVYVVTPSGRGSGFIIHRGKNTAYIATNEHVLLNNRGRITSRVKVVLYSGQSEETLIRAKVTGVDSDNDLAILKISRRMDFPEPIPLDPLGRPAETLQVFALGFPFGEAISLREGNPTPTFTPGSVSSLRKGENEILKAIQLDMNLNPGNSGGALITREGRLLGVNVATLLGTQISWAIPASKLADYVEGTAKNPVWSNHLQSEGGVELRLSLQVIDPLERIESVRVGLLPLSSELLDGRDGDNLPEAFVFQNGRQTTLTKTRDGSVTGPVNLPENYKPGKEVLVQIALRHQDGRNVYLPAETRKLRGVKAIEEGVTDVRLRTLPEMANTFAVNSQTGDLVAASKSNLSVNLYPAAFIEGDHDESQIKTHEFSHKPISVAYKRFKGISLYAVVCLNDPLLYLLNSETLEILDQIDMSVDSSSPHRQKNPALAISMVAAPHNPFDPHIYIAMGRGHDARLASYNLENKKFDSSIIPDCRDFGVSADGRYLYRRGPFSPSKFTSFARESRDGEVDWVALHSEHRGTPPYITDMHGQYVATGREIHSFDLKRRVATLDFNVSSFVPDMPLIVGIKEDRLLAASLNTFQEVGSVQLPESFAEVISKRKGISPTNPRSIYVLYQYEWVVLPSPATDRLYLCVEDMVLSVPISLIPIGGEPLLAGGLPGDLNLKTGETRFWHPELFSDDIEVSFPELPGFVEFDREKLVAHPGVVDIGAHELTMRLESGPFSYSRKFQFNVVHPYVQLDFEPQGIVTNAGATLAVVWEVNSRRTESKAALIDLEKLRVVEQTKLPMRITDALIIENRVLFYTNQGKNMQLHSMNDLGLISKSHIPPIVKVDAVNGKLIIMDHTKKARLFQLPDLSPLGTLGSWSPYEIHPVETIGEYWKIQEALYTRDLSKKILDYGGTRLEVYDASSSRRLKPNFRVIAPSRWGRKMDRYVLKSDSGHIVRTMPSRKIYTLRDLPVGVSMKTIELDRDYLVELSLYDLNTGLEIDRHPVAQFPDREKTMRFAVADHSVVFSYEKMISSLDLSDTQVEIEPLRLHPHGVPPLLPSTGTVRIEHPVAGGTPPYRFNLITEVAGMSIDPDSGLLTLNMEKITAMLVEKKRAEHRRRIFSPDQIEQSISLHGRMTSALRKKARQQRNLFEIETQTKISGLPIGLAVRLSVTDAEGREEFHAYNSFLTLDPFEILNPIDEELKRKADEEYLAANPGKPLAPPDNRLLQLERRIEDLEQKTDRLLRLLNALLAE